MPNEAIDRSAVANLPAELAQEMQRAIRAADADRIAELIASAAGYDAKLADDLRRRAEKFEYRQLLDFLATRTAEAA